MSRDLRSEVEAFLAEHGPSQAKTIALGVRARLADVNAVLAQEGFSQAKRPLGTHPHSVYWVASRRIPRIKRGSRGWTLLSILSDGKWHSRAEILERADRAFLTNNAASELRAARYDVQYEQGSYRLVSLAAPEGTESVSSAPPLSGAVSESGVSLAAPTGDGGKALLAGSQPSRPESSVGAASESERAAA